MSPYVKGDKLYRAYSGDIPEGYWLTPKNPGNQITAIRKLALPPSNTATNVAQVQVKSYFQAETSTVNGLFKQPGGGFQIHLNSFSNVTFGPTNSLPIGIMPFTLSNLFENISD